MKRLQALLLGCAAIVATIDETCSADGKAVYANACAVCHNALPPKLGDRAAWEPRLKLGIDTLVSSVINGKGAMPPKGGKARLSEAEIRAATEYLIDQSR